MDCCQLEKRDYEKILQFTNEIQEYTSDYRVRVLHYLSTIFSFHHSTFMLFNEEKEFNQLVSLNISDRLLRQYNDYYFKTDIFQPCNLPPHTSGKPVLSITDFMPIKLFENTEFYRDFLKQENLYYDMGIYLRKNNRLIGALGILKDRYSGGFTKREICILQSITPILSGCLDNYLGEIKNQRAQILYKNSIAQLSCGVIILDSNYSVFHYNDLANEYCKAITFRQKSVTNPISAVVKDALSNASFCNKECSSFINTSQGCYKLSMMSTMVPDPQKGTAVYYIINIHCISSSGQDKSCLIEDYKLTGRELEIVELVSRGLSNQEIAERLFLSYHTVRTHIENILRKMSVNNRTAIAHKLNII